MPNPWGNLPDDAPYLLEQDRRLIEHFNQEAAPQHHIYSTLLPEPFLGALDAPVVVLLQNPGIDGATHQQHGNQPFRQALLNNLRSPEQHPFHVYFDPTVVPWDNNNWWRQKTRQLVTDLGENGHEYLRRNLLAIEYFPYHSEQFKHAHLRLESQQFSFELVREAMNRNAIIIVARGWRVWMGAVHELMDYPHAYRLNSHQNVTISRRNLGNAAYEQVLAAIRNAP